MQCINVYCLCLHLQWQAGLAMYGKVPVLVSVPVELSSQTTAQLLGGKSVPI